MKNIFLLICSIITFLFATVTEVKGQGVITVLATAEVIDALSTRETAQLNFGRFSPETQGGKIIMTPDGVRTAEGTVALAGGTFNAASFFITGQYEATFSIALPSGPEMLTNSATDKTMVVTNWQSSPAPGEAAGKLLGGSVILRVGASLIVGDMNSNPVGIYTGTYAVTVVYN